MRNPNYVLYRFVETVACELDCHQYCDGCICECHRTIGENAFTEDEIEEFYYEQARDAWVSERQNDNGG